MERAIGIITANYATANPSALTAARPPAAVPIAGRYRMVDFPLSMMVNSGIRTIGMILPLKYGSIIDHVSAGKEWSLDRKNGGLFMMPGSTFGSTRTGGRFLIRDLENYKVFLDKADEKYVVLSSCNIIMNIDVQDLVDQHVKSDADITMACKKVSYDSDALMKVSLEKDRIVDASMGVQTGDVAFLDCCVMSIEALKNYLRWYGPDDYKDLFVALGSDLARYKVAPYWIEGTTLPVFSLHSYYESSMRFLDPDLIAEIFSSENPIRTKVHDVPPAKYEPGAKVSNSIVSAGCRIAGTVKNSILGRSVIVEEGAVVRNTIITQSCVLKKDVVVEYCVMDKYNILEEGTQLRGTKDSIFVQGKAPYTVPIG